MNASSDKKDVLVVVSKLKQYIKTTSGMNTSASAAPAISDFIKQLCSKAVENAKKDGRKTVMDRDFTFQQEACCSETAQPAQFQRAEHC